MTIKATVHIIVEDLIDRAEVEALRTKVQTFLDSETRAVLRVFMADEVLSPPEP